MPFCPICKNEYREGIAVCHECKVPLVDDLKDGPVAVLSGEQEYLDEILELCERNGLTTGFLHLNEENNALQLYFNKEEAEEAKKWIKEYLTGKEIERLAQKAGIAMEDMTPELAKQLQQEEVEEMKELRQMEKERISGRNTYVDKRDRADEYKSSGLVLSFVGCVGLVVLVLLYFGIIPGFQSLKSNFMFLGVMGLLFIVFIVMGIMSLSKVKNILSQAAEDEELTDWVKKFMDEKLTKEEIDHAIPCDEDGGEEEIFFKRAEFMENVLKSEFPDMEVSLCEKLIEERYSELYENNDH